MVVEGGFLLEARTVGSTQSLSRSNDENGMTSGPGFFVWFSTVSRL